MATVSDVLDVIRAAYPESLAEPWDTGIGLTCGDLQDEVDSVVLAVDVDAATVDEAITGGAQVLLTHHPLLFRPVQSVATGSPKGALVHRMIRAGVAHIAAHTNADTAPDGVNVALAQTLGLVDLRPLRPHTDLPADPIAPDSETERRTEWEATGSGRVGRLESAMTLRDFTGMVAQRLPRTVSGVRAAGDPDRVVRVVAVCGGAGDSYLGSAAASQADIYVTSDLRHHVVADFVATPGNPAIVEVAHWSGEWPWLRRAAAVLDAAFPGRITTRVSTVRTDPWTFQVPSV